MKVAKEKKGLSREQIYEIRSYMFAKEISQTQLAKIIGRSRVNVNNTLTGKSKGYYLGNTPDLIWKWYLKDKYETK